MIELTQICITSTAESALKKLQKAQIPIYNCKKRGASFIFCVKDKDIKKVFAIFAKPCYNIVVERGSAKKRLLGGLLLRAGLVVGALIFALSAYVSDYFVFKIEVSGSGSYLESVVREIIAEEGAGEYKPFSALDKPVATGRILAIPQVTFCSIQKRGSVMIIDVEVDESHTESAVRESLVSDVSGTVRNIVAICGTAAVEAGQAVSRGDVLIYASMQSGENTVASIAVGYAEIECTRTAEYIAPDDSESSIKEAYASLLLDGEEILSSSHKIAPTDGGVRIIMEVKFLHRISINLS